MCGFVVSAWRATFSAARFAVLFAAMRLARLRSTTGATRATTSIVIIIVIVIVIFIVIVILIAIAEAGLDRGSRSF